MFKYRHLISLFTTTLFYLLLAGSYIYLQSKYLVADQEPEEKVMHLSLATLVPVLEEPEEVEKEEPVVEEELEPVVEEKPIVEEIIPEPVVAKVVPKPIVKKKPKPKVKKRVKKKAKKQKAKKQKKVRKKATAKKKSSSGSKKSSKAQKNRFLSKVRAKIDRNKSYPKIAKRRGMQGSVKVRFTILRSGKVGNISVSGPKVFHSSAKRAVKKSFPISTKNVPISLPQSVNLTLRYQLR
ncbi:MAG: TonB family protein [Campylobacterota bacterium]|nr:TonB family protein [Campylobacterota bacterium]